MKSIGYGVYGQAEKPTLTQGLVSLFTPLATTTAAVIGEQQKTEINKARIAAGKEPCTGRPDQPYDCPSIFNPVAPPQQVTSGTPLMTSQGGKMSPVWFILGGLAVVGVILLLTKKKN